jgi:hypothetical protein
MGFSGFRILHVFLVPKAIFFVNKSEPKEDLFPSYSFLDGRFYVFAYLWLNFHSLLRFTGKLLTHCLEEEEKASGIFTYLCVMKNQIIGYLLELKVGF